MASTSEEGTDRIPAGAGWPESVVIHPTAHVDHRASLGEGCRVWHGAQIRERARLGEECSVGKDAYIDHDVQIGRFVKIQNRVSIYFDTRLEDGVFVGPHACLINDRYPRAITSDGHRKGNADWKPGLIIVRYGASIGAGAIVLPDVEIKQFALVGAASVVTHDVEPHSLVVGVPARVVGWVCCCARKLRRVEGELWRCDHCQEDYVPACEGGLQRRIG